MDALAVKPGTIIMLEELVKTPPEKLEGQAVRVMGRLIHYDASKNVCVLEDTPVRPHSERHTHLAPTYQLNVDTSRLSKFKFKMGVMFQFIGDIDVSSNKERVKVEGGGPAPGIVLLARVARNVEGIDVNLFYKALQVRRTFEATSL